MSYLVDPQILVSRAYSVNGFFAMITAEKVPMEVVDAIAEETVQNWSAEWDEGDGFGSSDMNFMIKEYIDEVITQTYIALGQTSGLYKVVFCPALTVLEYSNDDPHNKKQLWKDRGLK